MKQPAKRISIKKYSYKIKPDILAAHLHDIKEKSMLIGFFVNIFIFVGKIFRRIIRELNYLFDPIPINYSTKIRYRLKGFIPSNAIIYDFDNYNFDDYLKDYPLFGLFMRNRHFRDINKYYFLVPQDKIISNQMLSHHVDVPNILAYISEGEIYPLSETWSILKGEIKNVLTKTTLADISGDIFLKPLRGAKGEGVFKLSVIGNELFINGDGITFNELIIKLNKLKHYIAQKAVVQDEYGISLYPHSTNTMRLITMIDPFNYEVFMPFGVQRVGVKESAPLDSRRAGSISFPIDIENGTLGVGKKIVNYSIKYYKSHPDTGTMISGKIIPNWAYIKNTIINTANKFPYLKFLSWDVTISNGKVTVIEFGNTTTPFPIQLHYPIFTDMRVRKFFKYHNVKYGG